MRLIDADKMLAELLMINERSNIFAAPFARRIKRFIDRQPTVEERKHGHWIYVFDNEIMEPVYKCSLCKKTALYQCFSYDTVDSRYCPHCGAKMDEVTKQ